MYQKSLLSKLILFCFLFFTCAALFAQTPQFITGSSTSGNTIPFGSSYTNARCQYLYMPGEFGTSVTGRFITKIYIRMTTAAITGTTLTGLRIDIGQPSSITGLTTTWVTGLTTVRPAANLSVPATAQYGWIALPLTTPFLYNPALPIVIDTRHTALSTTFSIATGTTGSTNRRAYANTSTASAATAANTTRYEMGIDLADVPYGNDNAAIGIFNVSPVNFCTGSQPIKVKLINGGKNVLNTVSIKWKLNGVSQSPISFSYPLDSVGTTTGISDSVITLGTVVFTNDSQVVKVWTENPNSVTDPFPLNDTMSFTLKSKMNGTVTIGASGADYATFTAAVADLKARGVCGPVTFNVAPGTYSEQVAIDTIPGASSTNRITFNGTNASSRILTFAASSTSARHTIKLDGSSYITLKNLTIQGTGTYGWPVHVIDVNAIPTGIEVKNCIIDLPSTATTTNYAGIVINGSTSTATTGIVGASNFVIDSNLIRNGYYGITFPGSSTGLNLDNFVRKNIVTEVAYAGFYGSYHNGITISDNSFGCRKPGGSYGIYLTSSVCTGTRFHTIERNFIKHPGTGGIYLLTSGNTSAAPGRITQNMIGGDYDATTGYGIYISSGSYWNVYHNSINLSSAGTAATHAAFYVTTGTNLNVRNNIFYTSNPISQGMALYATNASSFLSLNNNLYYKPDTANGIVYVGGALFPSNFKGASGHNANSLFANPEFTSDTILNVANGCHNGAALGFTTDIYGNSRNTPPDMGAVELSGIANDLAIDLVVTPSSPISAGPQDVIVRIRNLGTTSISSANITYIHNGGTPVTQSWSGALNPCDTDRVVFTGSNQVTLVGANQLTIYTSSPNSSTDPNRTNDTSRSTLYVPLNGTYTIGAGGADFPSFTAAAARLSAAGITGPVLFNVLPGTYNEQAEIGSIPGTSATNTVTFEGTNPANRIVTFASASTGARHTIMINGARFVTLRNLTIRSTGTYGWPVHITDLNGIPRNCIVRKCIADIAGSTGPTSTSSNFAGIVVSGSVSSATTAVLADSITIDSNIVNNGYYGISIYGTSATPGVDNIIRNNTINNFYYYGVYNLYQNGVAINDNTIIGRKPGATYGIYFNSSTASGSRFHSIQRNYIKYPGTYGIYLGTSSNPSGNPGLVINNMIGGDFDATSTYGIYISTGSNWNIYHNSVNLNSAGTSTVHAALYVGAASNLNVRNNIFSTSNPASLGFALFSTTSTAFTALNNNVYYKPDTTNGIICVLDTLFPRNFKGFGGRNINSLFMNPNYTNDTLLNISNGCMNGAFVNITTDIYGNTRNNPPDMGAAELPTVSDDIGINAVLSPVFPMNPGLQDVVVRLYNQGTNAITSTNISYKLNNGTPVTYAWTGSLNPCDTITVTLTGSYQLNLPAGNNSLKVFTSAPNTIPDNNRLNDTITVQAITAMTGVYTIGGASPDFPTIASALNIMPQAGLAGPVIFKIRSGTYNGSFDLVPFSTLNAAHPVTFQSEANHRDSVIINYNASGTADNFIFRFNNVSYVTLRKLTLNALNSSYARGIEFVGNSSYDTVDNCKITSMPSTGTSQNLCGIYGDVLSGEYNMIRNNLITNGTTGIFFSGNSTTVLTGVNNTIEGNTITSAYYYGMYIYYTNSINIRNNIITSGTSTYSTYYGIYSYYCDNNPRITGNRITLTGLSATVTALRINYYDGLLNPGLVANNVIVVGTSGTSYGLWTQYTTNINYYNNSVNSISTGATNYAGYIYQSSTSYVNNTYRNNVFANNSTTGYALYTYNPIYPNTDYNLLYSTGAGLIYKGIATATGYTNLPSYRAANPGSETHSVNYPAVFTSNTNLLPKATDSLSWAMNGTGIQIPGNNTDVNGNPRSTTMINGAPDLGAYEFTPTSTPSRATAIPATPVAGGTQTFMYGTDTIARITWDATATAPTSIVGRLYQGVYPPGVTPSTDKSLNAFWDMTVPSGTYLYDIKLYYRNTWQGTITNKADMIVTKFSSGAWTHIYSPNSTVDTNAAILTGTALTSFSTFTGTENANPLPVKLSSFTARGSRNDVLLNWTTASEINSAHFDIQRSADGKTFETVSTISAKGNSTASTSYSFNDMNALENKSALYYRLHMVDRDGSSEESEVRLVVNNRMASETHITTYPNPVTQLLNVRIDAPGAANAIIRIFDLFGKEIKSQQATLNTGTNEIGLADLSDIQPGVYIIKIISGETEYTNRFIKK